MAFKEGVVVGPVSFNASGSAATTIGNASSSTGILGTANINITGSGGTSIGNVSSTTTIIGTTNINTTGSTNTNINTAGTGQVFIGRAASGAVTLIGPTININTSVLSSSAINIGTQPATSGNITMGNINTTITMSCGTGGMSLQSLASGGTFGISSNTSSSTVNIANGAGLKTLNLGSSMGTSTTVIRSGTGNITANTGLTVDSTGRMTNAVQPAFSAYLATSDANATGDATSYTLGAVTALTEIFDQNSDFNTNGTFTAPVTGRYFFGMNWLLTDVATANSVTFTLATSNRTYFHSNNASAFVGNNIYSWSQFADMDSGDTATTTTLVSGGAKIVDVFGDGNYRTTFFGYLVC